MEIVQIFQEGGIFMYAILAMGIISLYLLIDRTLGLYVHVKTVPDHFQTQLSTFLKNGDLAGAREFAKSNDNKLLTPIVDLACQLREQGAADDQLQARIDEALTHSIHKIDQRTSFLAVIGNVATLLGLLGTIAGMITSFSAVSSASATDRAAMLSAGISEAMNCTAFGLIVAIPALLGYAFFQSKTEKLVNNLTGSVAKLYNDMVYIYEPKRSSNR